MTTICAECKHCRPPKVRISVNVDDMVHHCLAMPKPRDPITGKQEYHWCEVIRRVISGDCLKFERRAKPSLAKRFWDWMERN